MNKEQAECTAFEINCMLKSLANVSDANIDKEVTKLDDMAKSLCLYAIEESKVPKKLKNKIIDDYVLIHNRNIIPSNIYKMLYKTEYYLAKMKELFEQQRKVVSVSLITLELLYERSIRELNVFNVEKNLDAILKEKLGVIIDGEYIEYSICNKFFNKKNIAEQMYVDLVQICNSKNNIRRVENELFMNIIKNWVKNI